MLKTALEQHSIARLYLPIGTYAMLGRTDSIQVAGLGWLPWLVFCGGGGGVRGIFASLALPGLARKSGDCHLRGVEESA